MVASNRRARHDYDIVDTTEYRIVLQGSEVKSLREARIALQDSYARIIDGEVWLFGVHVPPYAQATGFGAHEPDRRRKLLLHRRQIDEWMGKTQQSRSPWCRSPSTSRTAGPRSSWPWPGAGDSTTSATPSPPETRPRCGPGGPFTDGRGTDGSGPESDEDGALGPYRVRAHPGRVAAVQTLGSDVDR